MKTLFTLVLSCTVAFIGVSQVGSDCSTAVTVTPSSVCNYTNHTTSGTEYWLKFTASSPTINISLVTTKYGIDAPHIHALNLFDGSCGSLTLLAEDELPFYDEAKELNIDLNASNLVVGQTYYIRADRQATIHECGRTQCKLNGSTDPTTFDLCIEDVTVVIPPDFSDEKPVSSFALETNRGQLLNTDGTPADNVVMFNERINPALYVCKDHVSYVHHGVFAGDTSLQRVDMLFDGANTDYNIFKTEQVAGVTNYYLPHIPDGVTRNKSYSRVVSNDLYPNIDLQHYSNIAGMKNYFVVRQGGNYEDIVMKFDGATSVNINSDNLEVVSELGTLNFEKPHIYYVNPAGNVVPMPFEAYYQIVSGNKVKFTIPGYPSPQPMTLVIQMDQGHKTGAAKNIDNLVWSTYYGGFDDDFFYDVDHDASGNVYFSGYSRGLTFPLATQIIYPTTSNAGRLIVGKHKPYGEHEWSTLYGTSQDVGFGLATDNLNNVYVVGVTSGLTSQFLDVVQAGAYNLTPVMNSGAYGTIFRFNQNNGAVTWATLFGEHNTSSQFWNLCVEVDPWNNVYVGGKALRNGTSPIIATGSQYSQSTTGVFTGTMMKFNAGVNSLAWSTMFGNNGLAVSEMNITSNGDVYIVGSTSGTNTASFPMTVEQVNDYQQSYGGGSSDAFFAKFDSGNALKWSSFLGGASEDQGLGIDYHEGKNSLYITGLTVSDNTSFPLLALPDPLVHYSDIVNGQDGFITVLRDIPLVSDNPTTLGHVLKYSSYFGGSGDDLCRNVEISGAGNAYIIGMSKSTDYPLHQLTNGYYQTDLENDPTGLHFDSFILGLNPDLQVEWSTLYGGEWYYLGSNTSAQSDDVGQGITVYDDQHLYIGGWTNSQQDFPITVDLTNYPNAFIQYENSDDAFDSPDGWTDGYLAQFDLTGTILSLEEVGTDGIFGDLTVYPNPNDGSFVISSNNLINTGKLNLEVVNIVGQIVYSNELQVNGASLHETVELNNCSMGVYIITLSSGNNSVSKRIVIK